MPAGTGLFRETWFPWRSSIRLSPNIFALPQGTWPGTGRKVGAAKIVAVELACRLTELSQRAIGEHYGGIGSAAVSTIHRKVRNGQTPWKSRWPPCCKN